MEHDRKRRDVVRAGILAGAGLLTSRALTRPAAAGGSTNGPDTPEMGTFQAIRSRRSVRNFLPTPVPREDLNKIIQAARLAPTSGNQQPWKFLAVDDRAKIDELRAACVAYRLEAFRAQSDPTAAQLEQKEAGLLARFTPYLSAPAYIIVLTRNNSMYPDYNHWDGPLAAGTLMLAARALGYGTVFCTDTIPEPVTREVFAIPDDLTRVCITPVGVPVEWPAAPAKLPWRHFVAWNTL